MYNQTTMEIKIDKDLTPENAEQKNLIWVNDIIIDPEAPKEATTDIQEYIKKGCVIGQAASSSTTNNFFGLYKKRDMA